MNRPLRRLGRGIALILIPLLSRAPAPAQEPALADLDAYVTQTMHDWQVPGVAVGAVKDDALVLARGYGVRQLGRPGKVDEHTRFAIASNTKAFTVALLGMLVHEGKLRWDDRVIDHLRDFRLHDPYVTREIRVRDLLTHRSGLPTFGGDHLWIGNTLSRTEILRRVRHLKPNAPFRAKYQYQNLMYLAAGQIVPAITGESWDDAVKRRIFAPLGMAESNTSIRELEGLENVAAPHEVVGGKRVPVDYDLMDSSAPAGAINSTVVDMARWMRLNLHRGVFEGKAILAPAIVREMQSIQMPIPISPDREKLLGTRFAGYGLGWGLSDYRGLKLVTHGGGLTGMISYQILAPEKKLGVIVLTNFAPGSLAHALAYRILDALLGAPPTDWSARYLERKRERDERKRKAEEKLRERRVPNTQPSLDLEAYTGRYAEALSGEARVVLENGRLVFRYNPRYIGDLTHWHHDTFRLTWRHPIFDMRPRCFLSFHLNDAGSVAELEVTFYRPIRFRKLPPGK